MLPILLSLGPVKIYSYGVFFALGLFISLYFWWKMGRDEHWDEISLFDGFFLSLIVFGIVGRIGYVLLNLPELGTLYRFLAILAYPGISGIFGVVASSIFAILFARSQNWDVWKVADAYVVSLSAVLAVGGIGSILNGTNPVWQANVFLAIWGFLTFAIVSRVRKDFRFYAWYKGESSSAQEGLASLMFVGLLGVYYSIVGWIGEPLAKIAVVPVEFLVGMGLIVIAGYVIYRRIGRRESTIWSKLVSAIRRK